MDVVVCALDMAPTSKRVAAWAIRFARLLNCRLVLFHAIHMPSDPWDPAIGEGGAPRCGTGAISCMPI
jgi:hypothetical protein